MTKTLAPKPDYSEQFGHTLWDTAARGADSPRALSRFLALDEHGSRPSALDEKTKELIALAITVADRCDGCIPVRTRDTLKSGASRQEIMDALHVAVLMGGSPSMIYAGRVIDVVEQLQNQPRAPSMRRPLPGARSRASLKAPARRAEASGGLE